MGVFEDAFEATIAGDTERLSHLLLANPLLVNDTNHDRKTLLHIARAVPIAKILLAAGADPDAIDANGNTPLLLVSDVALVKYLAAHGADINAHRDFGWTCLLGAVYGKARDVAEAALKCGADITHTLENGEGVLHLAVDNGDLPMLEILLDHGANPNVCNEDGFTPLFSAVLEDCANVGCKLLEHGADPNIATIDGRTPLHLAATTSDRALVEILLRYGANPLATDRAGTSPIECADDPETKNLLLKARGASDPPP